MGFLSPRLNRLQRSADSDRFGEQVVQYAAALLREGHEPAVITGEVDHGGTELIGKRHCPFDVSPRATTMRVGAARSAAISGR